MEVPIRRIRVRWDFDSGESRISRIRMGVDWPAPPESRLGGVRRA